MDLNFLQQAAFADACHSGDETASSLARGNVVQRLIQLANLLVAANKIGQTKVSSTRFEIGDRKSVV